MLNLISSGRLRWNECIFIAQYPPHAVAAEEDNDDDDDDETLGVRIVKL